MRIKIPYNVENDNSEGFDLHESCLVLLLENEKVIDFRGVDLWSTP